MIRLFLDANILFTAAHNPSGKSAFIIELSNQRYWDVVTSDYAAEEARRNITIKFPDCTAHFEALLRSVKNVPSGVGNNCPVDLPEKDRLILEAAIQCKASHLLTGDIKDFGPYMNKPEKSGGVIIQKVADFLAGF